MASLVADTAPSVSPIYYVTFTSAVLAASFILFEGFNVTDDVKSVSLVAGFLTIFTGVYLLNFNGSDLESSELPLQYELVDIAGSLRTRLSFQGSPRSSIET